VVESLYGQGDLAFLHYGINGHFRAAENDSSTWCFMLQALKRPGRLGAEIFVGLPNDQTRREIFRVSFRRMPVADDVSLNDLVLRTARYTGAEVFYCIKEVGVKFI
jgi:ATP-dependent 26S proteasome regulatory subunit